MLHTKIKGRLVVLAVIIITTNAFAESQEIKNPLNNIHQTPKADVRGTDAMPVVIKLMNSGKSDIENAQDANVASWNLDLTIGLVFATLLQFGALIYQGYWLKRSVKISETAITDLERAAVFVEIIDPGFVIRGNGKFAIRDQESRFSYRFVNYGRTPAQLVERIESWPTEAGERTMPYPVDATKGGAPYPIGVIVGIDKPYNDSVRLQDIYPIMTSPQEDGACIHNTVLQQYNRYCVNYML